MKAYALSPAGPGYSGPGASPTQATGEPFAADSPYFPFSSRPGSRLSPAKTRVTPGIRPIKEDPQQAVTTLDNQQWVVSLFCNSIIFYSFFGRLKNFNYLMKCF